MPHASSSSVVLLDGGLGQEISRRSQRSEPHPLWSLQVMRDEPEVVTGVHRDFLVAGARVLTLNNYTATPARLAAHGMSDDFKAIHRQASALLDQAIEMSGCDRSELSKMGCLPPLAASYVAEVAPDYETARADYAALIDVQYTEVDGFLVETMSNIAEMRAARDALVEAHCAVRIGMTVEDDGSNRLRSGEPLEAALEVLAGGPIDAVVINCSQPESIAPALDLLKTLGCPYGAYANGFTTVATLRPGGTVKDLKQRVDLGPEAYTNHVLDWIEHGATVIGGCCEISPEHIAHLHRALLDRNLCVTKFSH